jgi:hypothetical protein
MIHFRTLAVVFMAIFLLSNCSETYQSYTIDLDQSTEVVTNSNKWKIHDFEITQKANLTTGDTALFKRVLLEVSDSTFPYPRVVRVEFYFNKMITDGQIGLDLSGTGVIKSALFTEFDFANPKYFSVFRENKTKVFPPVLNIYKYDSQRGIISGRLEGAVYDKDDDTVVRTLAITFQNQIIAEHQQ